MCGIVGYVGQKDSPGLLLDGLKRLEYRGYDSAGLAVIDDGSLGILRSVGKLANLHALQGRRPLKGPLGLGHTRWATHGRPTEENAHPHQDCAGKLAVVHNGIIENYGALKNYLQQKGHVFTSSTDTEVVAHLIEQRLKELQDHKPAGAEGGKESLLFEAVRRSLNELDGAYALAVIWSELPERIVAAKTASPLVIGVGEGESFVASDVPAFLEHTRHVVFLEDKEMAVLGAGHWAVFDLEGKPLEKISQRIDWDHTMARKSGFRHFMLKEIHEQPLAIENTLRGRLSPLYDGLLERETGLTLAALKGIKSVRLVACGTAWHASIVGKYLIERHARLPTHVETASEFRYRDPLLGPDTLVIAVSQSGETADTLAAVRLARQAGAKVLSVCNTVGSALARSADYNFFTHCGPECGVASTKAFIGQLAALTLLALYFSTALDTMSEREARSWQEELMRLPEMVREALGLEKAVREIAGRYHEAKHMLFMGRTLNYPTALEGALKLKEISYIHAEGYAAGEMKHGPIALIDPDMPVIAIATHSIVFEKMLSNIEEVRARGAQVIALSTWRRGNRLDGKADYVLEVPQAAEFISPVVNIIPLQLLAYHIADLRGCDVDCPRNLAKSVTVE